VIAAFEQPESLPKALAPMFIKRKDDVPCRRWSWHNQFIVALSGTTDARGIRQWNAAGRRIKEGSRAVWILAPLTKTIREQDDDGTEITRCILYWFKSVPVFRVEDTEGKPLPETDDEYDRWIRRLPLIEVAEAWQVNVGTYTHNSRSDPLGWYQYGNDAQRTVMLGVENLSTWAHELVHAADHRLGELKGDRSYAEIVAELGSAVLLECLDMPYEADLGGAYEYIRHYAERAEKPVIRACIDVLDRVCTCHPRHCGAARTRCCGIEPGGKRTMNTTSKSLIPVVTRNVADTLTPEQSRLSDDAAAREDERAGAGSCPNQAAYWTSVPRTTSSRK